MLLRIVLPEGTFIVDVGFGNLTQVAPLKLEPGVVQPTGFEPARLSAVSPDSFELAVEINAEWQPVYRFDFSRNHQIDWL
jgi:N-hydroxyarylamine O-acetyltransferase